MVKPTLVPNTGLGDAIVLSGAIVKLHFEYGGLRVPAIEENFDTVKSFFVHYPAIEVFSVKTDAELRYAYKNEKLQCYWTRVEGVVVNPLTSWDCWMYWQLNLPIEYRWSYCPIHGASAEVEQLTKPVLPYKLIHHDPLRGFSITNFDPEGSDPNLTIDLVSKYMDYGILSWVDVVYGAKEIHCIDSSFLHFVESLPQVTAKLFLHRYARLRLPVWHDVKTKYEWNVVNDRSARL